MKYRDYIPGPGKIKGHWTSSGMKDHPRQRLRALEIAVCTILELCVLTACAGPRLEVVATPSTPSVTLSGAGIHLTILPNAWSGYPSDLRRYYTPVQVRIENSRSDEIQVRYGDFLAVDESHTQYRAVAPAEVARALFGGRRLYPPRVWAPAPGLAPGARLVAMHDPWMWHPFWPHRFWSPFYSPFSPDPFTDFDSPYTYPRARAYDILTLGLREGRVVPGARVEGFLYLQLATQKGNLLTLSWTPVAADGKPLATLSSQFRIVR